MASKVMDCQFTVKELKAMLRAVNEMSKHFDNLHGRNEVGERGDAIRRALRNSNHLSVKIGKIISESGE